MSTPPSRRRRAPTLAAVLATMSLVTGACSGQDEQPRADRSLAPVDEAAPPVGSRETVCAITSDQGPVLLAFDLPRDYDQVELPGPRSAAATSADPCRWTGPPPPPSRGDRPVADTIVTLERADQPYATSLRTRAEDLRPDVGVGGDDGITDLELRTDVPVFGDTVGDRLSYVCSCDGVPEHVRQAEFAGLQLTLTSRPGDAEADAAFDAALASGGVRDELP